MSWVKDSETTITFQCDSCPETIIASGTFVECSAAIKRHGWISLKRTGFAWTHHCPKCVPEAEQEHEAHRLNELQRERLKAANEGRK